MPLLLPVGVAGVGYNERLCRAAKLGFFEVSIDLVAQLSRVRRVPRAGMWGAAWTHFLSITHFDFFFRFFSLFLFFLFRDVFIPSFNITQKHYYRPGFGDLHFSANQHMYQHACNKLKSKKWVISEKGQKNKLYDRPSLPTPNFPFQVTDTLSPRSLSPRCATLTTRKRKKALPKLRVTKLTEKYRTRKITFFSIQSCCWVLVAPTQANR